MGRDVCGDDQFLPETDLGFHYRSGPCDALVTLSDGSTLGLLHEGPLLTPVEFFIRVWMFAG